MDDQEFFKCAATRIHVSLFDDLPPGELLDSEIGAVKQVYDSLPDGAQRSLRKNMLRAFHLESVEYFMRLRGIHSGLTECYQSVIAIAETSPSLRELLINRRRRMIFGYGALASHACRSILLGALGWILVTFYWND